MDHSCTDGRLVDVVIEPRPRIVHVTKTPPSSSGIARHAGPFDRALDGLGPRDTLGLSVEAAASQRLSVAVMLNARLRRRLRQTSVDLVVVDLSGRALAELFGACLIAARRRRPTLWLAAHDAPEMVGAPLLLSFLDRRGGRRLGMALSNSLGRVIERWLVERSDAVLAFSELGATSLRARFPRAHVRAVPLPTEVLARRAKEPVVYCPAGLRPGDLLPALAAFASGRLPAAMRLRVGSLSDAQRREVEQSCEAFGLVDRVEFTGMLDQAALDDSFATAAIVVRHHSQEVRPANWAAASGPIVSALAAGCAVISTDRRGSRRCVATAGIDLADEPDRLVDELVRLANAPDVADRLGASALDHVRRHHVPEAVTRHLESIWHDSRRVAGSSEGRVGTARRPANPAGPQGRSTPGRATP